MAMAVMIEIHAETDEIAQRAIEALLSIGLDDLAATNVPLVVNVSAIAPINSRDN